MTAVCAAYRVVAPSALGMSAVAGYIVCVVSVMVSVITFYEWKREVRRKETAYQAQNHTPKRQHSVQKGRDYPHGKLKMH